jgi:carbohydrate kinase (thermoresistant glucokinase family)
MGVSGVGKTRLGLALAGALGARFVEGDDLHPPENRALMAAGTPLTDWERWPWLDRVGAALAEGPPPVVGACSALARRYRDRLRAQVPELVCLHLQGEPRLIGERLGARQGHFMPPALLGSQFAALEPLEADEAGLVVDVERPPEEVLKALLAGIARL